MNEVEKMYKNAGVEPYKYCYNCFDNNGKIIKDSKDCPSRKSCCNTCDTPEYNFTAEKQLELIKWLAIKGDVCRIDTTVKEKWFVENEVQTSECFAEFENSLANVINKLWADMPEEERKQIKEILESEVRE